MGALAVLAQMAEGVLVRVRLPRAGAARFTENQAQRTGRRSGASISPPASGSRWSTTVRSRPSVRRHARLCTAGSELTASPRRPSSSTCVGRGATHRELRSASELRRAVPAAAPRVVAGQHPAPRPGQATRGSFVARSIRRRRTDCPYSVVSSTARIDRRAGSTTTPSSRSTTAGRSRLRRAAPLRGLERLHRRRGRHGRGHRPRGAGDRRQPRRPHRLPRAVRPDAVRRY